MNEDVVFEADAKVAQKLVNKAGVGNDGACDKAHPCAVSGAAPEQDGQECDYTPQG